MAIVDVHELQISPEVNEIIPVLKKSNIQILLTSTSAQIKILAQKLDVDIFLQKPFDADSLLCKIKSLFEER